MSQFNWASTQTAQFYAYVYGTNPTCPNFNNGKADLIVFGTVAPVTYLWSNGATTDSLRNLTQGAYNVTITDAMGFSLVETVTLSNISGIYPLIEIVRQPSCPNFVNGAVRVNSVFGGTAPFSYLWSNGATTKAISSLSEGDYNVTITDANGCSTQLTQSLIKYYPYVYIQTTQPPTCPTFNNGIVEFVAYPGAVPPFTFLWNNGATTSSINNVSQCNYTLSVTDANGCLSSQTTFVTNSAVDIYAYSVQNLTCPSYNNGIISVLHVLNGVPPYSYLWSNGATTNTIDNLTEGNYQLTVTDANGCTGVSSIFLQKSISFYAYLDINQNVSCANGADNGEVEVKGIFGGNAPYTYLWNNGFTTSIISNLSVGTYTVTITDANGCKADFSISLINQGLYPSTTVTQQPTYPNFDNGTAEVLGVFNGTAPYNYLWCNGATSATVGNLSNGIYSVAAPSHTYTQAGRYNVTLTCQDSCGTIASRTVTIDIGNFVTLNAKVYLQANYDLTTGIMDDFMRSSDLIPTNEPYSSIFNHVSSANETTTKAILSQSTFPTVVDWIFVELRDANNSASILATRAGLLLQNGKIVDTDGTSALRFSTASSNNYYIAIRHRNHLGFRSLNPIALNQNGVSIDFTNNSTQLFGMIPMTNVNGSLVMISGDANSDGSIDAFDTVLWENQNGTFDNYDNADYNLDGSVDAFDSIIWEFNNGKFEELD